MKRAAVLCSTVVLAFTLAGSSEDALTNNDVLRMVQANLPESVIMAKIATSRGRFDTSPDALIKLKQAGASDAVLEAMMKATAPSPAGEADSRRPPAQSGGEGKTSICSIRTVFVTGNSMSADAIRKGLREGPYLHEEPAGRWARAKFRAKWASAVPRTWMTLLDSEKEAGAILDVSETRSIGGVLHQYPVLTVSVTLTRSEPKHLLWSGSDNSSSGLIKRLNEEAGCLP